MEIDKVNTITAYLNILSEKVLDSKPGDDNLKVELSVRGKKYIVRVYKDGKIEEVYKFDKRKEAEQKFNKIYTEF
tara:strand:+ start:331 stop:555 length:225 start_codon:yes stop_codon:yes gene_type:complete